MTRYAKRKLKYSFNENFDLLLYVEWGRFVTLTGAQAEWGLRYRIYAVNRALFYIHSMVLLERGLKIQR